MLSFLLALLSFASSSAFAESDLQLALNWKPEPQFGGFYAALGENPKNSLFEKQGLKVKILEGGSGTPTIQMLAYGKVDFAIVSAEEILISNERNPKNQIVAVFATFQTNPQILMCHTARNLHGIREIYENKGTLAIQSGLTYAQFLKKKFTPSKVDVVPYLGGITNYLANPAYCQQGFATSEPLLAKKAGKPAQTFLISDEGFNPYTTVLAVRAETLEKFPERVSKMVTAVRQGWNNYLKDPQPTNQRMALLNRSMDLDTFNQSAELQKPLIETALVKGKNLGTMTAERWDQLISQLKSLDVIHSPTEAKNIYRNL